MIPKRILGVALTLAWILLWIWLGIQVVLLAPSATPNAVLESILLLWFVTGSRIIAESSWIAARAVGWYRRWRRASLRRRALPGVRVVTWPRSAGHA